MAIGKTYTSSFGAGTQGSSQQRFLEALRSATGTPKSKTQATQQELQAGVMSLAADYPASEAYTTQEAKQNAQLPQMAGQYADEAKLLTMFQADQGLAQKYTRPDMASMEVPTQNVGVATSGTVGTPQTPSATVESLAQGFQGFTTPGAVTSSIGSAKDNILSALDIITKGITFQSGEVKKQVDANSKAYETTMNALTKLADMYGQMYQNEVTSKRESETQRRAELYQKIDAKYKFGGTVDQEISDITGLPIGTIIPGLSNKSSGNAANLIKMTSGMNIIGDINKIPSEVKESTGTKEAMVVNTKLKFPGGIGKMFIKNDAERQLADLQSKYFLLVQTALTIVQGARPSDYDTQTWLDQAGPSILNTPEVNEDRLNTLLSLIEQSKGIPSTTNSVNNNVMLEEP